MIELTSITIEDWEKRMMRRLTKCKMKSIEMTNAFGFDQLEYKYEVEGKIKGHRVKWSFTKRSGLAVLFIENQNIKHLFETKRFFINTYSSRLTNFFVEFLNEYATLVNASAMVIAFEYDTIFPLEKEGFERMNSLENADIVTRYINMGTKMWYKDLLPNFTNAFIQTYKLFFDIAKNYEDKTLYMIPEWLDDYEQRPGYQIEYAGVSLFLELSYVDDYNWTYICCQEGQQTEMSLDEREQFLPDIKKKQRLLNLFSPPSFHFDRFFEYARIYSVEKDTVYQAFNQDYSDEEIEVLFATQLDEIKDSVELIHEEEYRIYRIWNYYIAGRIHCKQNERSCFYANTLDELKEQILAYEREYLDREYRGKMMGFEDRMQHVSHTM